MFLNDVYPFSDIHDTPSISSLLQPSSSPHRRRQVGLFKVLTIFSHQRPKTPFFWKAAFSRRPLRERCSVPEEPVLRAPLLRTFSPASAVSLVRNKPAAEVRNLKKRASGEMLRRCLLVCHRCVSDGFCLLFCVRFGGRMWLKCERGGGGGGSATRRRQRQDAGHQRWKIFFFFPPNFAGSRTDTHTLSTMSF